MRQLDVATNFLDDVFDGDDTERTAFR